MKGVLKNREAQWFVWHWDEITQGYDSIPVHPYLEKYYFLDEDAEGSEVEFEIEDFWETGLEQVYKAAKLIKPEYQSDDKTWDEIFVEVEGSLHFEMPIRVKNWLKNKFKSPVKK
jgi:hypothetical protein